MAKSTETPNRDKANKCGSLLSALIGLVICFSSSSFAGESMETFYITAPWLPGKVIVAKGKDSLDALTNVSLTVWTKEQWEEVSQIPRMPKAEEIDWRR